MAKESSEGEFLKKKSVDHNRKRTEIYPRQMLLAPNVTDHSYFDGVYLKIFTALSFLANLRLLSFTNVL